MPDLLCYLLVDLKWIEDRKGDFIISMALTGRPLQRTYRICWTESPNISLVNLMGGVGSPSVYVLFLLVNE